MPRASPLFIDKIAVTIALDNEGARDRISEWFHSHAESVYGYQVSDTRGGRFYSVSKEIVFNAETRCKLLVEYGPRGGRRRVMNAINSDAAGDAESVPDIDIVALADTRRPLRLEWNPAQLLAVPEYQEAFLAIMRNWFGPALEAEIANANITRIDLATDVEHIDINDLLIARSDTTVTSSTYGRDGRIQTIYLGSKNSDMRFAIYDKQAQQGGMVARTRFEARLKHRLTIDTLRTFPNPFSRLTVREAMHLEVGTRGNNEFVWYWLIDSIRQRGAEAALNLIRNSRTRSTWHNKVAMRDSPRWWNPDALWSGLGEAISSTGLWRPTRGRRRYIR